MNYKEFFQSKYVSRMLYSIGVIVIIITIFQAGVLTGYRKAIFAGQMGETYFKTFGEYNRNTPNGMMGMMQIGRDNFFSNSHGAVGKVIKIDLPNILIEGPDNIEKTIIVGKDTMIRKFKSTASTSDLTPDTNIIVIGEPTDSGVINAKLIRFVPDKGMADRMMGSTSPLVTPIK